MRQIGEPPGGEAPAVKQDSDSEEEAADDYLSETAATPEGLKMRA